MLSGTYRKHTVDKVQVRNTQRTGCKLVSIKTSCEEVIWGSVYLRLLSNGVYQAKFLEEKFNKLLTLNPTHTHHRRNILQDIKDKLTELLVLTALEGHRFLCDLWLSFVKNSEGTMVSKISPIMSPCSWIIIPRSLKMSLMSTMSDWIEQPQRQNDYKCDCRKSQSCGGFTVAPPAA